MQENNFYSYIKDLWEKYGYKLFVFTGLIGVMMIYLSENNASVVTAEEGNTVSEYRHYLEKSLTELLSAVEGAGEVKLMITLESGEENVYVTQEKTDTDRQSVSSQQSQQINSRSSYENQVVMMKDGSVSGALVEKTLQPVVQGVVVVCQGAGNIKVVSDITNAVSVVLNIPTNRVCVIKMQ